MTTGAPSSEPPVLDGSGRILPENSGLIAYASLLAMHRIAVDPDQLRHSLGHHREIDSDDLRRLAKREEELWTVGRPHPIRLARKDPALKLVQRVRDEAHRFAITNHRGRRARRMRETSLTDIPGIGPVRARRLLREFGSLAGLAAANPDRIAEVVGPSSARAVRSYLGGAARPA